MTQDHAININSAFTFAESKNRHLYIALAVLSVFFFSDAINTVLWIRGEPPKFSIYFRAFFQAIVLMSLFSALFSGTKLSSTNAKLAVLWILGVIFAMFGCLISMMHSPYANLFNTLHSVNKYLFVYLLFYFLTASFHATPINARKYFFKFYELIIYINAICPVIGLLFGIDLFESYPFGWKRFGYKGFIPIANDASVFWLIALFYSFVVFTDEKRKLPLFCSIIASALVGTKALYLCMPLAMMVYLLKFYPKYGIVATVAFISSLVFAIEFYLSDFLSLLSDRGDASSIVQTISALMNEGDVLIQLSSGRFSMEKDSLVTNFYASLYYWIPLNYLFGGAVSGGTEMDLYDVFSTFGIAGTILLLTGFSAIFLHIRKSFRLFFAAFIILLAVCSGHVMDNAMCMTYLCLFVLRAEERR
jgi:hypothetical protein